MAQGPKHDTELRAQHRIEVAARVGGAITGDIGPVGIGPEADRAADPVRPVHCVLAEHADAAFLDLIFANGRKRDALLGVEEPNIDRVVAALHANCGLALGPAQDGAEVGLAGAAAKHETIIFLPELVAVDRVIQKVGEVVEQREVALDHIGIDAGRRLGRGLVPAPRE